MEDLSHLAAKALAVSSMSGGNTVSSNEAAMTGPGSPPVDAMPNQKEQADPALTVTAHARTTRTQGGPYAPSAPVWKETPDG
jgi:hypothetical protein